MRDLPEGWIRFETIERHATADEPAVIRPGAKKRFPDGELREVVGSSERGLYLAALQTEAHYESPAATPWDLWPTEAEQA